MNRICVFCGSSMGNKPVYKESAVKLAHFFLKNNITLVYGGANVGLMKVIADILVKNKREVIGIMPKYLIAKEVAHNEISQMIEVDSMAERKTMMIQMSDAFMALPGGFGTLDEIAEVLVLDQLRIVEKPMGLINVNNYFDPLMVFLKNGAQQGFVREEHLNNVFIDTEISGLFSKLKSYRPVEMTKWIKTIKNESK